MSPAPALLPQVNELEEQLGRRPEQEELDLARAALAAAEDEKLELRKRLEETERRLVGLEEEGGCLHPHPVWPGWAQAPSGTSTNCTPLQWGCSRRSWSSRARRRSCLRPCPRRPHHPRRCHHLRPLSLQSK